VVPLLVRGLVIECVTPSSVATFRQWFRNNRAQDEVEKVVLYVPDQNGYDPARAVINTEIASVESAAMGDPNQVHSDVQPPATPGLVQPAVFPCKLRF
jgi:hypothetical protein